MRRRTLLGGDNVEYVFSAQSTSVSVSYSSSYAYVSINIKSTANGSNIGYSVVSYDGTVVTNVTTAATSVTIYYSANYNYDERSGSVVLKQNDSNKTITINVSQAAKPLDLGYGGILLDGTSGSYCSIDGDNVRFSDMPDWAYATHYTSGEIKVTASSTNSASTARIATITVRGGSQSKSLAIIQLPSDYHSRDYVSIGGLNWAIKNVGANSVQDYGNYYMYGKGSQTFNSSDSYYEGQENPLASSADTATQVMGEGWRMPTQTECRALTANSYYFVSYNGVNGGVFESSGEVLFFPASGRRGSNPSYEGSYGYVWSSTPSSGSYAYLMFWYSVDKFVDVRLRRYGCPVRGVQA